MLSEKFTDETTGRLVRITSPYEDWAFVPAPLPPDWDFPASLWPLVAEAKQLLGKLDGVGRTLPNPELLQRPLQQREALRSSSLEGTYASPQELLLFELQPRVPSSAKDKANDWLEVSNYASALREGYLYLQQGPLSLYLVRQLHAWLLKGVRGADKQPGSFRKRQVHLGSDRRFVPPPPERLDDCLQAFEHALMTPPNDFDPLVRSYLVHYQLEAIHPFLDGNGRVGRLLLALTTWLWCDLSMPWLYMSSFFERYKDEYIDSLFAVSAKGAWEEWITFCLRGTVEEAGDAIRRCEDLGRLKNQMMRRIKSGSARLYDTIGELFTTPVLSIPGVQQRRQVSYPTAKSDVDRLREAGILEAIKDSSHPKLYYSPEIFKVAFGEME